MSEWLTPVKKGWLMAVLILRGLGFYLALLHLSTRPSVVFPVDGFGPRCDTTALMEMDLAFATLWFADAQCGCQADAKSILGDAEC
jgi:hypothetical protein